MARTPKVKGDTKVCTCCKSSGRIGDDDPKANDFYRDKSQAGGFATWCKSCERTYNQAYFGAMKKVEVSRVRDIETDAGKATYMRTMSKSGVRVTRTSKVKAVAPAKASKDGTRTTRAKATTAERKTARATKRTKVAA